ncbi:hypothetical protein AB0O16_04710 [Microbacterium sp. NPDC089180]|uniref:Uncharacterized protein n=1 Tax=Microbacterium galbum TaxID=3075994 RepID=A0ABU3T6W7_9MICO|nr:hypothetical protein [Microbacterium sp. KSW4-17]MDU0367079.1 hypothetical protein [Microbacterium sp. KSW4-17]
MAYFIALGILSLAGIIGTVWLIRTDGYGRIPTDPSRLASTERARAVPTTKVGQPLTPATAVGQPAPATEVAQSAKPITATIAVPRPGGRLA